MDTHALVKSLHILGATILFGTGLGIAWFSWAGGRSRASAVQLFAAEATVTADFLFTLPAVILQPATGAWLVWRTGVDPWDRWLVLTYAIYVLAGVCWLPVVWIQMSLRDQLRARAAGEPFDAVAHARLRRWWFWLGWPAFIGLLAVVHLMVTKPTW